MTNFFGTLPGRFYGFTNVARGYYRATNGDRGNSWKDCFHYCLLIGVETAIMEPIRFQN